MDISEQGMFLGSYSKGERDIFGLWREMQENEPRQVEGHYIEGKKSGLQVGFEILDSGIPGERVFQELYQKGELKNREEFKIEEQKGWEY